MNAGSKKTILLLGLVFGIVAGARAAEVSIIHEKAESVDIYADQNDIVHIIWRTKTGFVKYGQIKNNTIVNIEGIPDSDWIQPKRKRPRLVVSPNGKYVATTFCPFDESAVYIAIRDAGGWRTEKIYQTSGGYSVSNPAVAIDDFGNIHAFVASWKPGEIVASLVYMRKQAARNWKISLFTTKPYEYDVPVMFVDRDNRTHLLVNAIDYSISPADDYEYYARIDAGAEFNDADLVKMTRPNLNYMPDQGDLYVDRRGGVHVALVCFTMRRSSTFDYWYKAPGEANFRPPVTIKGPHATVGEGHLYTSQPAVGADDAGAVWVSWGECTQTENADVVQIRKYDPVSRSWNSETIGDGVDIFNQSKTCIALTHQLMYMVWGGDTDIKLRTEPAYGLPGGFSVVLKTPSYQDTVKGVVTIEAEVREADPAKVEFFVASQKLGEKTAAPYTWEWNTYGVANGQYEVKVIVTTTDNRTAQDYVLATVYNEQGVALISPSAQLPVFGSIPVQAVVLGVQPVTRIDFFVNDQLIISDSVAPYGFDWDTTALARGSYVLKAVAIFTNGVVSDFSQTVQKASPLVGPLAGSIVNETGKLLTRRLHYHTLSWSANPQAVGVVKYLVYFAGESGFTLAGEAAGTTFLHRGLNASIHYRYAIVAVDGIGVLSDPLLITE
jgi:hypothetical protein